MAEEAHKSRAERRREEKAKRKLGNQLNKEFKGYTQEQIDRFFEASCNIDAIVDERIKAFAADCTERMKAHEQDCYVRYNKQFQDKVRQIQDEERRGYDKRMRRPKLEIKREVKGELMAMTFWVLRDYFDFTPEDLHKFNHQMIRLDASMKEPEKLGCITVDHLITQMKKEGFDLLDDTTLVDEMVEAEMANYLRPEAPQKGTVFNVWHEDEDERLKRLILEQHRDYPEISLVLGRTVKACQGRVRKLFGTQVLDKVRGVRA